MERRNFIKTVFGMILGFLGVQSGLLKAESGEKKLKLVDENSATAKANNYSHEGERNPLRKNPKSFCINCVQYKKVGEVDGEEVGRCNIIPGGVVKSKGWCKSWVKNPKVAL